MYKTKGSTVASQQQGPGFDPWFEQGHHCAWSLHVLFVHAWDSSSYSGFLSHSKDMQIMLNSCSKMPINAKVSMDDSLSLCLPCDRVAPSPGCTPPCTRSQLGLALPSPQPLIDKWYR